MRDPDPSARPESAPEAGDKTEQQHRAYICDRCGFEMVEDHCKVVCPNCGARWDCSDLSIYTD